MAKDCLVVGAMVVGIYGNGEKVLSQISSRQPVGAYTGWSCC